MSINRRSLLALLGSVPAATMTLVLPAHSIAAQISSNPQLIAVVNVGNALEMLSRYQFTIAEQCKILGQPDLDSFEQLREAAVAAAGDGALQIHADFLLSIQQRLNERFGKENLAEQLIWMRSPQPMFKHSSLHQQIRCGHIMSLIDAERILRENL